MSKNKIHVALMDLESGTATEPEKEPPETPSIVPTVLVSRSNANDILVIENTEHKVPSLINERKSRVPHSKHRAKVDHFRGRYPHSIVWSPIPVVTWFLPFIGHLGIAYTNGKIRDFADSYLVSEDKMTFSKPTKYWTLNPDGAENGWEGWDKGVFDAAEEYTLKDHDHLCDNSASMVALALNLMIYKKSKSWNMFWVIFLTLVHSRYTDCIGFWKTYCPFLALIAVASVIGFSAWKIQHQPH